MKKFLSILSVLFLSVLFIGCGDSIREYEPLVDTTNDAYDMLSTYKKAPLDKLGLYDEKLKEYIENYEKLIGNVIIEHPNLPWFDFTEQLDNRKLRARLERIYLKVK